MTSLFKFSVLLSLIRKTNLTKSVLENLDKFTLLAPTDETFKRLSPTLLQNLQKKENENTLKSILNYHIISNESPSKLGSLPNIIEINEILIPPFLNNDIKSLS